MAFEIDSDIYAHNPYELRILVQKLRNAIRKHRDAKGHEACWLNDQDLYKALPEYGGVVSKELPGLPEFIAKCVEYHQQQVKCGANPNDDIANCGRVRS